MSELPGDARVRTEIEDTSGEAALLAAEEGGAEVRASVEWLERQPTSSQRCVVCGDNEVPRRVALIFADGRECFICKDASWCQARATANVYEDLILGART